MSIYVCFICDRYIDNDYSPCSEYKNELICEDCDAEIHDEDGITYHKSQIIPFDKGTVVYWAEKDGKAWDILEESVPDYVKVIDETHRKQNAPEGAS